MVQQVKELTEIYENTKKENARIYNELQDQAITLLNLTEENEAMRDLLQSKQIEIPQREALGKESLTKKASEKRGREFEKAMQELNDYLQRNIKIEDKRPDHILAKLSGLYNDLFVKYEVLTEKHKRYIEFVTDLQQELEVKLFLLKINR